MATAKLEIVSTTHSPEEIASILSDFTSAGLVRRKQLFGGYSGSNYLVELDDGTQFVLKITNGYSAEHAELMCRTAYHLGEAGYRDCCLPIPTCENAEHRFVSTKEQCGVPAFLLTFVDGRQADQVMREQPHLAVTVMHGIGGGLARMHAASTGIGKDETEKFGLRWYKRDGGCCDVQDQIDGKVLSNIILCKSEQKNVFLRFYENELESLRTEMKLATEEKLTHGITHGDPFADNVLVDAETGKLTAFIDIEDVCAGPLLFDLACSVIGCCFKKSPEKESKYPQRLDMALLAALLEGYCADRKLPEIEKEHFVPFMRLTLLCNCCWRFVKFNSVGTGDNFPEEAKNSYLELQQRIEYLHDPEVVQAVNNILVAIA